MLEIDSKLSIVFYSQMDKQTERINQELEQYLRMFIDHCQEQWLEWLGTAKFTYNNKMQTSIKMSSFMANNGRNSHIGFKLRKRKKFEEAHEKNIGDTKGSKSSAGKDTGGHEEVCKQV